MPHATPTAPFARDPLARLLEWGLAVWLVAAPLPFGGVPPDARLGLEIGAGILGLLWLLRAGTAAPVLPRPALLGALAGLLILALLQIAPLGSAAVGVISPRAAEIRAETQPPPDVLKAEARLLGAEARRHEPRATLSLDPQATASALRLGTALFVLVIVSTTVAATRGARLLGAALLASAAFQGLYGLLVLASGHEQIWHVAKRHYLDAATGTYVNKNHFAALLAMALPIGLALVLGHLRRARDARRPALAALLGGEGHRALLGAIAVAVALAGLLASFSRAGIAVGLLALLLTLAAAGGERRLGARLLTAILFLSVAAMPLAQLGADRLIDRYSAASDDLVRDGGRASVWADTLRMARAFPVTGSGFGTFDATYPRFRSPEVRLRYDHAHNDLLQAWSESGVVGGLLLAFVALLLARRLFDALTGRCGTLAVGFAAGLLALALHSLVDFNFHIPANAATGAILVGALEGLPWPRRT